MNHDQEHIRRLIQLDRQVAQLFNEFLAQVAPHLKKIKYGGRGVWSKNRRIEMQVDEVLGRFVAKYKALLQAYMQKSWELSEVKNDQLFMKLVKGAGIIVAGKMLLRIFDRKVPGQGAGPVDITNVLTFPRRSSAMEKYLKNRLDKVISPRVWNLAGQNKVLIHRTIQSGILEGKSAAAISRDLRKYLNEPNKLFRRVRDPKTGQLVPSKAMREYHPGRGVYRSSYENALRLAQNEINMSYRMADLERWRSDPTVLGYEIKRSASGIPCEICDSLVGRYPKSFTWVAWHVSCFCYAVPILPNRDQFIKYLETGDLKATPVKGIPREATTYIKKNTEKILGMQTKPYWMENFKITANNEIKLNI